MAFYAIDGVVPVVLAGAFVHPDATLIGNVIIRAGAYIGPATSLRGDMGAVDVGAGANVQDGCVLHTYPGRNVIIEEDGHIGHGAVLHGCHIGRGALVGMGAVVMDEVVVGEQAFVGACSFVPAGMEVPARRVAAGIPAEIRRELTETDLAWKANGTRLYQELARRSLSTLVETQPLSEIPDPPQTLPIGRDASSPLHEHRH